MSSSGHIIPAGPQPSGAPDNGGAAVGGRLRSPDGHLPGLDLIRAAAITLVLAAHLPGNANPDGAIARLRFSCGALGVDVFFALSGFLIGGILIDTGSRLKETRILAGFWLNRWLRTLPNFYLLFAVNLWLGTIVFTRRHLEWEDVLRTAVFCQNLTHAPGWFFMEAWSLSIEEWFYLLLPLGLWLGLRARLSFRVVLGVLLAAMICVPLIRRGFSPVWADWTFGVNVIVPNRFDGLGCGVAAAWCARAWPDRWRTSASTLAVVGVLLLAGCMSLAQWPSFEHRGWALKLLPFLQPLSCALLLPVASAWSGWRVPLLAGTTAAVARWSYSLYLVNSSVAFALDRALRARGSVNEFTILAADACFLVASFALAAALYRWFERPILRLRSRVPLCREAAAAKHSPSAEGRPRSAGEAAA